MSILYSETKIKPEMHVKYKGQEKYPKSVSIKAHRYGAHL